MFLAVLGRQPKISLAELESLYGADNIKQLSPQIASVNTTSFDLNRLGGTVKAGEILARPLLDHLATLPAGKITLGLSDYNKNATSKSAGQAALKLKSVLKRHGRSVRIIPNNSAPVLSSAASHHNQLGEKTNHIEVIIFQKFTALSSGTQNITAYAKRDQARPARDAFVGMLPPKLAQILINLATGDATAGAGQTGVALDCAQLRRAQAPRPVTTGPRTRVQSNSSLSGSTTGCLLDPFCGTGTILQEALLMGFSVYGTDLSEKMIAYSRKNLDWLTSRHKPNPVTTGPRTRVQGDLITLAPADATTHTWQPPIDFIASEIYLGLPFSAPPSDLKLKEVQFTTKNILLAFLKNLHPQIKTCTSLALAIPAWRRPDNSFSFLNCLDEIKKLGYNVHQFKHATSSELLYHRESQVVARQIIVLRKI